MVRQLKWIGTCVSILLFLLLGVSAQTTNNYQPGPDSKPQPGVPKGEVIKFTFEKSKIFPGTVRDYWIYVPAQSRMRNPPACTSDRTAFDWEAPNVFDNLIARNQMPVTIGVFVAPGVVKSPEPNAALDRFNRSFEYDGLGDNYVRFLLEELLPEVETKQTPDGRPIKLSPDGNDRAIGGSSSGAIAAFTAAWERPDAFTRVFSSIGTYVGLRGGIDIRSHPQVRAETDSHLSSRRLRRPQHLRR